MNKKSESGQVIVLLVFAVIGLIGFTALAIDGGMVYSDRRHAQSASDAASLTGGGEIAFWLNNNFIFKKDFSCSGVVGEKIYHIMRYGEQEAWYRALANDYFDGEIKISTVCEDNGPLFDEKYIDITTHITRESNTALIHFVYDGPATNQVESTVRIRPTNPVVNGNAIVALNKDPCLGNQNGIILGGSSGTIVEGGGIFSNGCLRCDGLNNYDEELAPAPVYVEGGSISFAGNISNCSNEDLEPNASFSPEPLPESLWTLDVPNCRNGIEIESITKSMYLQTGKLYCITSDKNAIKLTNGELVGINVTLYFPNGGDIEINGGTVVLSAPDSDPDPSPAIGGVVIFVNPDFKSIIKINGNADSSYDGMIYAPNADVEVSGTSSVDEGPVVFHTQIIGYNVHITGDAIIDIDFDDENKKLKPAYIDMYK